MDLRLQSLAHFVITGEIAIGLLAHHRVAVDGAIRHAQNRRMRFDQHRLVAWAGDVRLELPACVFWRERRTVGVMMEGEVVQPIVGQEYIVWTERRSIQVFEEPFAGWALNDHLSVWICLIRYIKPSLRRAVRMAVAA